MLWRKSERERGRTAPLTLLLNSGRLVCFADRLLLQRLRKSQSGTALYGESQQAAEELTEPSVYSVYEGTTTQRLIVVANRLPVSAVKERDGSWSLQVGSRHTCMGGLWLVTCHHPCSHPKCRGFQDRGDQQSRRNILILLSRSAREAWSAH